MSIRMHVTFHCNGCSAVADAGVHAAPRKFRSFSGRDYGLGCWFVEYPNVVDMYPEGWEDDPYTSALYCEDCAKEIWPEWYEEEGK